MDTLPKIPKKKQSEHAGRYSQVARMEGHQHHISGFWFYSHEPDELYLQVLKELNKK